MAAGTAVGCRVREGKKNHGSVIPLVHLDLLHPEYKHFKVQLQSVLQCGAAE